MNLKAFQQSLREETFGPTPEGCCVACKEPFSAKNVWTPAGWREIEISQMCEECWDRTFKGFADSEA